MQRTEEGQIGDDGYVLADSVTQIASIGAGKVVLCGSHGGGYSAICALAAGVDGIVFNDASVGRDQAGIEGLSVLDRHGVPAATVGRTTAVIGTGMETAQGRLTYVNSVAAELGIGPGMSATEFVDLVVAAGPLAFPDLPLPTAEESRVEILDSPVRVWALDSVSLANSGDDGTVIVTGSHAQLLGGVPESALRAEARLAVFNDAGGVIAPSRLDVLEARGIAAVAVAATSARIGEAVSSYSEGVISTVNEIAKANGARGGMKVEDLIARVIENASEAKIR